MYHNELQDFYDIIYGNPDKYYSIKNLINFWEKNKNNWFNGEEIELKTCIKQDINNIYDYVSLLLHYDQIYRHPIKYIDRIKTNDILALRFSTNLAFKIIHHKDWNLLPLYLKIFTLLAIRHNNNIKLKYFVLNKLDDMINIHTENLTLRFMNATILDINKMKLNTYDFYVKPLADNTDIHTFDNILEFSGNNKELNMMERISGKILDIEKYIYDNLEKFKKSKIAISISGGVDSMVLSYICKKYSIDIILLHICYNNRDECEDEKNLLRYWSNKINSKLYIRDIDEIKRSRNSKYRKIYEDVTKEIRFSFYKLFDFPVFLGHNKDDTQENIFTNLEKQNHFNNLLGMDTNTIINNVEIYRPFLKISKKEIIDYAKDNNIPFLNDSTPSWSKRGQLRDTLIPQINAFNTNILNGMDKYIEQHNFLYEQWRVSLTSWIKNITIKENLYILKRDEFFESNKNQMEFWKQIFFYIFKNTRPSNSSIENMIFILNKKNGEKGKINLRKDTTMYVYPNKLIIEII